MSNAMAVIVGPQQPSRWADFGQVVYMDADKLTLSELIGSLINSRDGQQAACYDPRLSLDNLGCIPHTGDKE